MAVQKFEITIITANEAGVLSELMRAVGTQGMMYRRNKKINEGNVDKVILTVEGNLSGDTSDLVSAIEELPLVEFVEGIEEVSSSRVFKSATNSSVKPVVVKPKEASSEIKRSAKKRSDNSKVSSDLIQPYDVITPEVLKIAEKRLTDILGLVAPILVKQASMLMNLNSAGQLFDALAEELNDDNERAQFLSIIATEITEPADPKPDKKKKENIFTKKRTVKGLFQ